jgi:hypothetical protein
MKVTHAMQPIYLDPRGVIRFKANAIIRKFFCRDDEQMSRMISLNDIHVEDFPIEDVEQFWQLLGYSVSGYGDLSFVRKKTVALADRKAEALMKRGRSKKKKGARQT